MFLPKPLPAPCPDMRTQNSAASACDAAPCTVANCQTFNAADSCLCDTCAAGYARSINGQACTACSMANCATYDTNTCTCNTCATGFALSGGSCTAVSGKYKLVKALARPSIERLTCKAGAVALAITCASYHSLLQCPATRPNCATMSANTCNGCATCAAGYSLDANGNCIKCSVANCGTYTTNTCTCTACNTGYSLASNTCTAVSGRAAACIRDGGGWRLLVPAVHVLTCRVHIFPNLPPILQCTDVPNCAVGGMNANKCSGCDTCLPGYKRSADGRTCEQCTREGCTAYTQNTCDCTACSNSYALKSAACQACPDLVNCSAMKANKCDGCQTCAQDYEQVAEELTGISICSLCKDVTNCAADGMNADSCQGCDTCAATYARVNNGQTCQACTKVGCTAYDSNTCDCTTCAAQYELDGTSCKAVSEGARGAGCAAAEPIAAAGGRACLRCWPAGALSPGPCPPILQCTDVPNCAVGGMNANKCSGCDTCLPGYKRSADGRTCEQCTREGCTAYTQNMCDCTACSNSYALQGTACQACPTVSNCVTPKANKCDGCQACAQDYEQVAEELTGISICSLCKDVTNCAADGMNADSCQGCDTCAATYARVNNGQTCQACTKVGCTAYDSNTCDCTTCAAQYELDGTSCKAVSEGATGAGCAAAHRRHR